MRFERTPSTAALWIGVSFTIVIVAMAALRQVGRTVAQTCKQEVALDTSQVVRN